MTIRHVVSVSGGKDSTYTLWYVVKELKLKPLVVTGERRAPLLAQVPTLLESGWPGFEPLGFVMGLSRRAEQTIDPLVEILRPISGIAWLPLALFIFGVGDTLPVFIMFYVGFFPILLNTVAGVRQTDSRLLAAARTMGIGRVPLLVHVLVPSALPTIMVGIRLAFASSWAAIVAAELIGSPSGLGFAIEWYRQLLMTPKVFAFILAIGVVGYVCDLGLRALQRRVTPWAESMGASS